MFDKFKAVLHAFFKNMMTYRADACKAELERRGFRFDSNGNITGYGSNVF
jgi:hypothetical protein